MLLIQEAFRNEVFLGKECETTQQSKYFPPACMKQKSCGNFSPPLKRLQGETIYTAITCCLESARLVLLRRSPLYTGI